MGPLAVSAFNPLTLSMASALRPLPALPLPAAPNGKASTSTTLSIQDLAQGLFQRNLQAATLSALTEPAAGSAGLAAEATGSLLAALTAPQAPADTTATADATTVPAMVQTTDASSAPTSAPPATVPGDVSAAQDPNALSSSQDFALEAALRFGAGVASQVAPTLQAGVMGAGLVRDAAAVPRLGNLQSRTGGPGPEAYAQRQASVQRVARTYEAIRATQGFGGAGQMDILA
ncbi:MAG TPA: hypothetical protein VF378_06535 [Geothrix sp.]